MKRRFIGVIVLSLIFLGGQLLQAQKVNPANQMKKNTITQNMHPTVKVVPIKTTKVTASVMAEPTSSNDQILEENAFLQGQYVEVGISSCGCFGTTVEQPTGFHGNIDDYLGFVADPDKDGWDVGDPAFNGDYFMPGSPEEGWGIEIDGINYGNFSQCEDNSIPGMIKSIKFENNMHTAVWEGELDSLQVTQDVSFMDDATFFIITATLKNTSSDTVKNLFYMRNVDPDNENPATGNYSTLNKIFFQGDVDTCNKAMVGATGLVYGMFLGLGTADERARVTYGGFSNRSASDVWYGLNGLSLSGSLQSDIGVSLSFNIGDLPPGESTTVVYAYILDSAQIDEAFDALIKLNANGDDISSTNIHSNCDQPVDLIVTGNSDMIWEWTKSPYLSDTIGSHVVFNAPLGTYNLSASGTNNCKQVIFNFQIVIETDDTPPEAIARETFVTYFGTNDTAYVTVEDINMGSSDNCELDTMYVTPAYITKADSGKIVPVVLTVIDSKGLVSTATTMVSILTYAQNSVLEKIIHYQDIGNASALTIEQLDSLMIDSVVTANLSIYKDYVEGDWPKTIKTLDDVQALITEANAVQLILDMIDAGDASDIMLSTLHDAGSSAAVAENLKWYAIFLIWEGASDRWDIKYDVSVANKFDLIDKMALNNDASTLSIYKLWDVDMWNAVEDNIEAYRTWIEDLTTIEHPDSLDNLIDQINAFMEIVRMAVNNNASGLSISLLEDAGVIEPNGNNLVIYKDSIAALDTIQTLTELQELIDMIDADEAFKLIVDMAYNDDASTLTLVMVKDVGVKLVFSDFMSYYKDSIAAADTFITKQEVIDVIEEINTKMSFIKIQEMASNDDASTLTNNLLIAAGVTGSKDLYIETYKQFVADADTIIDVPGLQSLIDEATVQGAFEMIQMMAYNDDASALTIAILTDATVQSLVGDNLQFYMISVETADTIIAIEDLQSLIDVVNGWVVLGEMTYTKDASSLTTDLLDLLGATQVSADNLAFYKYFVSSSDTIKTTATLQTVVDKANTLAAINAMAVSGNASALTATMLTAVGGTNVIEANLPNYKMYLADADEVMTLAELQNIINAANAFTEIITMFNSGNMDGLTIQMLIDAGVENTQSSNLALYKSVIKDASSIADLAALQALIDMANQTGIEIATVDGLKIYPIPAENYLVIEGNFNNARLISMDGKVILNIESASKSTIVDISGFKPCLYILETTNSSETSQHMIVKN